MRLWSISPKYLDTKGLVALWREGLLAQKVLLGETKGYKNHPQLERFKKEDIKVLGYYLSIIWHESKERGYNFDINKIPEMVSTKQLTVTRGQLEYEFKHLGRKLIERCPDKYLENMEKCGTTNIDIEPHPLFKVIEGNVETWEKIK